MGYSVKYVIAFAAAVCAICGLFVSVSAVSLKSRQEANKVLDKQKKVLSVVGLLDESNPKSAEQIAKLFEDNIQAKIVTLATGEYDDAVDVGTFDQRKWSKDLRIRITDVGDTKLSIGDDVEKDALEEENERATEDDGRPAVGFAKSKKAPGACCTCKPYLLYLS